ncbi:hypothetical protein [Mucilaginibacter sp. CSA2-8R]|uniref:hypothetical protein n=1 Tax=Mucilaginibacter sp. CSA2-8R TaxID=3141542 RepID=UPI00315C521D
MKLLPHFFTGMVAVLAGCKPVTSPDRLINAKASLPHTFKLSELHQKVITSFITNSTHTTSILYGNAEAYAADTASHPVHALGQSFTLITWRQQDDAHWFGARIPGNLISAETLTITGKADAIEYNYQRLLGKNLVKLADTTGNAARVKYILSQKAFITP